MDVDYSAKLMHPSGKPYMEGDTEVTLGQGVFILVNTVPQELKLSLLDSCQLSRIVSEAAQGGNGVLKDKDVQLLRRLLENSPRMTPLLRAELARHILP